jgi:hypothetical protein
MFLPGELTMPDPDKIPDLSYLRKRREEARQIRRRASVDETIQRNRTTLLINLFIEIFSGLVLLAGIVFAIYFITLRRNAISPEQYKLYIGVLGFFSIGWFTYVGFKIRKKFLLYREYSKKEKSAKNEDDSETDDS